MLENILITYRGDPLPLGSAAAQPNRLIAESRKRFITAETTHV
jgi:hypothetical protein